ncbi:rhomboid-like protein [Rhodococcus sp. X156]|uniref:rhomboid-like protein n=1 Tax=Rhodococcus sp. X156 TaxID=2499145 RepID=UPI000FD6C131|nr:rhomboid-like protein [Rhodococcus sp. X156]
MLHLRRLPRIGRSVPVTLSYLGALGTVGLALSTVGTHWKDAVISAASTNVHNLSQWRLSTLVSSAFVIAEGPVWFTCLGVGATLALAERAWGGWRMLSTFVAGHLLATSLVAVGLWFGISSGWFPVSWSQATDVGVSYGVFAVLTALTFAVPRGWRLTWAAVWLVLAVQAVLSAPTFTAVGHLVAGVVGLVLAALVHRRHPLTPRRPMTTRGSLALLAWASLFGLCIVGWATPGWWSAPVLAAVVVLATRIRPVGRADLPVSCAPARSGASPAAPSASVVVAAPVPTGRRALVPPRR